MFADEDQMTAFIKAFTQFSFAQKWFEDCVYMIRHHRIGVEPVGIAVELL